MLVLLKEEDNQECITFSLMLISLKRNNNQEFINLSLMPVSLKGKDQQECIRFSLLYVLFGLIWVYGISNIVSYIMPNPFLYV